MTKQELNQLCTEYQQMLRMGEQEVFDRYEETKSECAAGFETEIDYWENELGYND